MALGAAALGALAAPIARRAAGRGPAAPPSLQRGLALIRDQRCDEAIRAFTRAIRAQADAATAYVYRGIASFEAGRLDDSVAGFTAALARHPEGAVVHRYRGDSYLALGESARAVADYRRASDLAASGERLAVTARTKLWLMDRQPAAGDIGGG